MVNKRFFARAGTGKEASSPRVRGDEVEDEVDQALYADADRARHAGAAQSAIARRILGEILLMIVLGEIEFGRRRDLGGDGAETLGSKRLLIHRLRRVGGFALRIAERVDRRTILRADIVALAHALRRVVIFPERLQQLLVGDLLRIEHDQHHFGVTGAARADLFIGRVGGVAAGIADGGRIDAVAEFPELALGAPETAEPEHRLLEACGIRRLQLAAVDEMGGGGRDRRGAARQRFGCARQCGGLAHEQHGVPPGGTSADAANGGGRLDFYIGLYAGRGSPVTHAAWQSRTAGQSRE